MADGGDPSGSDRARPSAEHPAQPPSDGDRLHTDGRPSPLGILVGVALAMAAVGFFAGTRRGLAPPVAGLAKAHHLPTNGGASAPSYSDLRTRRWGPNARMYAAQVRDLALSAPSSTDVILRGTPEQKQLALDARAQRRAYAGAPPVVPHAVDQTGLPPCLSCHERGAMAAGRIAPAMSHQRLDNCLQCHVPGNSPFPLRDQPRTDNTFVGLGSPTAGDRAWPGAPPVIPHRTFMREACASCHGVAELPGIRSTHPWRQSCTQCHGTSALLDQRVSLAP